MTSTGQNIEQTLHIHELVECLCDMYRHRNPCFIQIHICVYVIAERYYTVSTPLSIGVQKLIWDSVVDKYGGCIMLG